MCNIVFTILLHAARRAMAAAPPLPKQRRWAFYISVFPWPQTDKTGHSRATNHQKENAEKQKGNSHLGRCVEPRSSSHPAPFPPGLPPWPYSSMASSGADPCSFSTSIASPGASWVLIGGSSGGGASPRCFHLGEGDLCPFASPRAAFFFRQALAWAKWRSYSSRIWPQCDYTSGPS